MTFQLQVEKAVKVVTADAALLAEQFGDSALLAVDGALLTVVHERLRALLEVIGSPKGLCHETVFSIYWSTFKELVSKRQKKKPKNTSVGAQKHWP